MASSSPATASSSAAVQPIAPVVHAIGGCLGSALALLLLYPLERARIEMQSVAARPLQNDNDKHQHSPASFLDEPSTVKAEASGLSQTLTLEESKRRTDETEGFVHVQHSDEEQQEQQQTQVMLRSSQGVEGKKVSLSECFQRLWNRKELYRGVAPIVSTLAISNYIFFYVNALMKRLISLGKDERRSLSSYWLLIASCLAGICNVLVTNPLWVTNLRIVTGQASSPSLLAEMRELARKHGIAHLWKGTGTSILLVTNPVIQFFTYDQLKTLLLSRRSPSSSYDYDDDSLSPLQAFVAGAVAKTIATVLTYPLQLTQAVLRLQERNSMGSTNKDNEENEEKEPPYRGTWDCLVRMYKARGPEGLFTGMRAKLLQTVLTAAFTFLTYEQILHVVHTTHLALRSSEKKG